MKVRARGCVTMDIQMVCTLEHAKVGFDYPVALF